MAHNGGGTSKLETGGGQTRRLAKFAHSLRYDELPAEVREIAKSCILDTLGCALLCSTYPWGRIVSKYVKLTAGRAESTVIGKGFKVPAGLAALANGTMAHGFEADDVYIPAIHHPGAVVVPAALATAEREGTSGRAFIAAVVAGYEVMNRIGEAATESHLMRGFFPTGTNGTFGAAAAAGNLIRLNEDQMTNALGIAGSQSSGVFEGIKEGRMTKRFLAGTAAQRGLMAADLAKLGLTGPTTVVEGDWGYLRSHSDRVDFSRLTENLGRNYRIMETTFKPYPCCKGIHAAIDGVLELNREYHFNPGDVEEIIIGGYEKLVKMHDIYEPATPMAAQFSIPYTVSVALLKGSPGVEAFTDRSIRDRKVLDFARKVRTVVDPEVVPYFPENEPSKVTVRLKNTKTYSKTVIHSKGTPENPMDGIELEEKFRAFASLVISKRRVERTMQLIRQLDTLNKVTQLTSLLRKKA